jgi:tRNA(Ile)-lysidine synthase
MPSLAERVRRTIRRHDLVPPGTRLAVALSGGADSVALLTLLGALAGEGGFALAGVVHLNHRLRGAESDADEAFCRNLAVDRSLPFVAESVDVARLARQARQSLEHAAHDARYAFFARASGQLGADRVAVGHTRDDQAETFLLRLLRGAGPRGLAGIHPRSGAIVRPMIECGREEVRGFLREQGIAYREDATNADVGILRNRVRHELLPLLRDRFTPGIVSVLDREATIARDDAAYLEAEAARVGARLITVTAAGAEILSDALLAEPPALSRRVLHEAQRQVSGRPFIDFAAVDALWEYVASGATGPLDLPGQRAERVGGRVVLSRRAGRRAVRPGALAFEYRLDVPGRVNVPEAGCEILAETTALKGPGAAADLLLSRTGAVAVVDAGRVEEPLVVRNRRPGDLVRPLGLAGHKKLQDLFVDLKIRRTERDLVPLIVDRRGLIVWVCGCAIAEDARVTDRTEAVVVLRMVQEA